MNKKRFKPVELFEPLKPLISRDCAICSLTIHAPFKCMNNPDRNKRFLRCNQVKTKIVLISYIIFFIIYIRFKTYGQQ